MNIEQRLKRKEKVESILFQLLVWAGCPAATAIGACLAFLVDEPMVLSIFGAVIAVITAIPTMMIAVCAIVYLFAGIGIGIAKLWNWAWLPRGTAPGAEVKMIPYSTPKKEK